MSNATDTYQVPSLADYQAADGATKRSMRAAAEKAMRHALATDEFVLAKEINQALSTWAPAKASAPEVDWQTLVAVRVATLRALADGIESGDIVPAGVPEGFTYEGDEIGQEPDQGTLDRLNSIRVGNSKAEGGDWQARFDQAFEGLEVGAFLRVQEIANKVGLPKGSGAVAARLFPGEGKVCTLKGYEPVDATADQPRGARKIA
jgi:hypothetical protein